MPPFHQRASQIGLAIEGTPGSEETLVAADYSGNRKEHTHAYRSASYQRGNTRGTQTRERPLRSMHSLEIGFTEELVGGTASTAPQWDVTLRALGFQVEAASKITVTSPSGAFSVGDVFGDNASQGSATALGEVIHHDVGGGLLYYVATTGAFGDTDTLTNYTQTGAGTVSGSPGAAGRRYRPITTRDAQSPPTVTAQRRIGGELHSLVAGRGVGGLSFRQEQPALLRATMTGAPVLDANGITPRTATFLAGVAQIASPPKVSQGLPLRFRDAADYTPILTELDLDFRNAIAQRPTISDADFEESGHLTTEITSREPSFSVDPEHVVASTFDWAGRMRAGDPFQVVCRLGLPADTHGMIVVHGKEAQIDGDVEPGDRDGIVTQPLTCGLYGDDDDEITISHIFNEE